MTRFLVFLDSAGAQYGSGRISGNKVLVSRGRVRRTTPVSIDTVEMNSSASGAVKGALAGNLLLGPLGALFGAMAGGASRVRFRIETKQGISLLCECGQSEWPGIRKQVESAIRNDHVRNQAGKLLGSAGALSWRATKTGTLIGATLLGEAARYGHSQYLERKRARAAEGVNEEDDQDPPRDQG